MKKTSSVIGLALGLAAWFIANRMGIELPTINGYGLDGTGSPIAIGVAGALGGYLLNEKFAISDHFTGITDSVIPSTDPSFEEIVNAVKLIDDYLGDDEETINSRKKILLGIFEKSREK